MWHRMTSALRRSGVWSRDRRDYTSLAAMDDSLLRDIGVHRARVTGRDSFA